MSPLLSIGPTLMGLLSAKNPTQVFGWVIDPQTKYSKLPLILWILSKGHWPLPERLSIKGGVSHVEIRFCT